MPAPSTSYNAENARCANEIGRMIRAGRKSLGMTQSGLAAALVPWGVAVQAAAVAKWESGDNVPSGYQLLALCHALGLQDGIFSFTGAALPADLNAEGYRLLNEFHAFLASSGKYSAGGISPSRRTVEMRIYDLPASAGTGNLLDSDHFELQTFPADTVPEGADFGVRVTGDSMEPAYHDGQIAWVHSCEELHEGEVGVFFYDGSSYIKEYHEVYPADKHVPAADSVIQYPRIALRSVNPAYVDIPVTDGSCRLFGRVLN